MKAYKIVVIEEGRKYSARIDDETYDSLGRLIRTSTRVEYKKGRGSKRMEGAGPLTAFRSLKAVKAFLTRYGGANESLEVWECRTSAISCEESALIEETGVALWRSHVTLGERKGYPNCSGVFGLKNLPIGTILCDSITLLQKKIGIRECRRIIDLDSIFVGG